MYRREFLRLAASGLALSGMPSLLGACRRGAPDPSEAASLGELTDTLARRGARKALDVFRSGEDYGVGFPNYLGLGLVRTKGEPVTGVGASFWLVPSADPDEEAKPIGPVRAPWRGYAKPEAGGPTGIHAAEATFNRPGIWTIVAETQGPRLFGTAAIEVKPKGTTSTRVPGEPGIPSQTPTLEDRRGVDPICTRRPPCDMHRVTLANALNTGKPVAFMVATPAFCMSRTCGPNLEELIAVQGEVGDKATFVHAEVYKDDHPETIEQQVVSPTFREWRLLSEPWLFLIDGSGTIASRFEGPLTADVIRSAFAPLLR